MVGVGIEGEESSLARVSLVNFYGVVIMDEFVRQKERVVDYRTQWSGIRESDMIHGTSHSKSLTNRASAHAYVLFSKALRGGAKTCFGSSERQDTRRPCCT